mgnify:CR=1 FL=1
MQACGHYVGAERISEESRVEMSQLTGSRVHRHDALSQVQHTIVMAGAFFSALPIPSLRQGLIALKPVRSSVIVG